MKKRGRGIACMWYPIGFTVAANASAAVVKVNEDGTATVLTGTVETGQGSLTVLGQIAAEELGIATDDVHVVSADTDTTPMDTGAIASRTTYVTGNAIRLAAEKAKEILFQVAAPMLGVKPEQLEARDRKIQVKNYPQRCIGIGEVANHAQFVMGQPALGSASYNPHTVSLDPETGQGKPFASSPRTIAARRSIRCWSKARSRAAFRWGSASRCRRKCCSIKTASSLIRT
jgi:CO/xanthine dehydrogenase Mo-binding subunit